MRIGDYATLVFDCDGVLLDSNRVKTAAFHAAASPYGEDAAQRLVDYHTSRGGVSRYLKFEWFLRDVVGAVDEQRLQALLASYAALARKGLLECRVAEGLHALRAATPGARWLVASGGDQQELRDVFAVRGLDVLFDGGIYGSPTSKEDIVREQLASGNIRQPALFLGDSRYDHVAAAAGGMDFVFVSAWSEFHDWRDYVAEHGLRSVGAVDELLATAS